jgi:PqqD family protein of HPr-rel-A system
MAESWRADRTVLWTTYDDSDEWVVFHPASGHVHSVTAAARHLWVMAADLPRTTEQLLSGLASHLGKPVEPELEQAVRDTIDFMDRAGLLRPDRS